jgi:hypothetical protein
MPADSNREQIASGAPYPANQGGGFLRRLGPTVSGSCSRAAVSGRLDTKDGVVKENRRQHLRAGQCDADSFSTWMRD